MSGKPSKQKPEFKQPRSSLELARLCRVSQGTVDRALHDRGRIAPATRERIVAMAAKYGYIPHPGAREMLTGTSRFVAVIVPAGSSLFFADITESLREVLGRHGLRLIMSPAKDGSEAAELVREFAGRRVQGIVVVSPEPDMAIDTSVVRRQPMVALVNPCKSKLVHFVAPDEEETAESAVAYLQDRGHRSIVHVSYPRRSWAIASRENGYRRAMKRFGDKPQICFLETGESFVHTMAALKPTALFCHNDYLAIETIRTLAAHGIVVPQDMSVMGVDDSPTMGGLYPGLTTMHYPFSEVALCAVGFLCGEPTESVRLKCTVIERESVRSFV